MKKIVFVAHCLLNTASKVDLYDKEEIESEEKLRREFLSKAIEKGIQIIQLPCPEFTLYGTCRWGHVSNQFDNPFFRNHCKKILEPIFEQLDEYLEHKEKFEILGIVGIDGSPSCGVDYTCYSKTYGGSFGKRENIDEVLSDCKLINSEGILISVIKEELEKRNYISKVPVVGLYASEPNKCLGILR